MLEQLDTFIAFSAVMLGASLFVTIFTQAASNLLNARGRNLSRGLSVLFTTLEPELEKVAQPLAKHILTDALVASSAWQQVSALRLDELVLLSRSNRFVHIARGAVDECWKGWSAQERTELLQWLGSTGVSLPPTPREEDIVSALTKAVVDCVRAREDDIKAWFEYGMDRVSQRSLRTCAR